MMDEAEQEEALQRVSNILDAEPHKLEARDAKLNYTLLMGATQLGEVRLAQLLLEEGAEVDALHPCGSTSLFAAASNGHEELVSLLLSFGADSTRKSIEGVTPLSCASGNGHLGVVRQLLQHMRGCGLDEINYMGLTALWKACRHGEIFRLLLLAGADHTAGYREKMLRWLPEEGYRESLTILEWWKGELERGYVLHRAGCLSELPLTLTAPATAAIPTYLAARTGPPPTVQVESLVEGSEGAEGKGNADEEGGEVEGEGRGEEEKDATLRFVMQDLASELFIELMAGFHPFKVTPPPLPMEVYHRSKVKYCYYFEDESEEEHDG